MFALLFCFFVCFSVLFVCLFCSSSFWKGRGGGGGREGPEGRVRLGGESVIQKLQLASRRQLGMSFVVVDIVVDSCVLFFVHSPIWIRGRGNGRDPKDRIGLQRTK